MGRREVLNTGPQSLLQQRAKQMESSSINPPAGPGELAPVDPQERILLMDVLRGFALFGVLWSNLNDWYGTKEAITGLQQALAWTQSWMLESRFYTLLGFLFGMGFAIQLTRAEQRGVNVRPMFCRRMAALLAIGLLHGLLIWRGDVLTQYALLGFLLLAYRRLSPLRLLVATAATYVLLPYIINVALMATGLRPPMPMPAKEIAWTYAHGTLAQIMLQGARDYLFHYQRWSLFLFPPFLTLFLLGMWAVRANLLQRLMDRRRLLVWILVGTVCSAIVTPYLINQLLHVWPGPRGRPTLWESLFSLRALRGVVLESMSWLPDWSNAAAYAAGLALLATFAGWARRLQPLAAVGRMSLTTYLMQSVVSVGLFYHYGLGLYGRVGFDGMFVITIVLFALQLAASIWWLRRYHFGPMEWLWRSAAYWKAQPMRREPAENLTVV